MGGRQFGAVDQHDVDFLGRLGDIEDRIAEPVRSGDFGAVEGDRLRQRGAGALHDVAFDAAAEAIRVGDQPVIMGDSEFARMTYGQL